MTLSTSAVAVCCCSDSVRSSVRACTSSNSRTFSIAITAWSAKVSTSSICLSVERVAQTSGSRPTHQLAHLRAAAEHRDECGSCRVSGFPSQYIPDRRAHRRYERTRCSSWTRPTSAAPPRRETTPCACGHRIPRYDRSSRRSRIRCRSPSAAAPGPCRRRTGCAADSTSVSSTVCRSNVERLMTLSTSAVAVCCCKRFAQVIRSLLQFVE